jgi:hypothetical protein
MGKGCSSRLSPHSPTNDPLMALSARLQGSTQPASEGLQRIKELLQSFRLIVEFQGCKIILAISLITVMLINLELGQIIHNILVIRGWSD